MKENEIVEEINKDRCYTVYMHTSPSGKRYIGITRQKPEERWLNGRGYQHQMFYRAIQKYGFDNFIHEILYTNLTKEEAEQKEVELIKHYKSNNSKFGYNIENGGSTAGKMSESTKRKISEINKGRFVGRKLSEEWLRNRSIAQTGLKRTKETKNKIREAVSVKVICINNRVVYGSLTEASEITGADISHISSCCHKDRRFAGYDNDGNGLCWMFYDEYLKRGYDQKASEEIIAEYIPKRKINKSSKKVICLNTKVVYDNSQVAYESTGVSKSGIYRCCKKERKHAGKDKDGNWLRWMFYDEYLKDGVQCDKIA